MLYGFVRISRRHAPRALAALLLAGALSVVTPAGAERAQPGEYAAGWRRVAVSRVPFGGSGTFNALVFHPASSAGQTVPLDLRGAPYPAISFGHGFLQSVEQYRSTCEHLATHGYVVIATESESGLFPSHAGMAADMRHCLSYLAAQSSTSGTFLTGAIDAARFGVSGHSMGGGAGILAAAADSRVKCLAPLAAANTNPSAISAMENVRAPIALLAGSQDGITPLGQHQQPMYANGNDPRQLVVIQGGFHCGFTDAGSFGCDSGGITRSAQLALTRRLLTEFFDLYLKSDVSAWRAVWGPEAFAEPGVTRTAQPGSRFTPATQTVTGFAGQFVDVGLLFENTTELLASYDVLVEGETAAAPVWPLEIVPAAAITLSPGTSVALTVRVTIPVGGVSAATLLVSARTATDGGTRSWARATINRDWRRGDMNCDAAINFADIDGFVLAVVGEVTYAAAYPTCDWVNADINHDGSVDFNDVDAFVAALVGG